MPLTSDLTLFLSIGAVVVALGTLFKMLSNVPWVTKAEHLDLLARINRIENKLDGLFCAKNKIC